MSFQRNIAGQLFYPDNSGYAEKRVQSYDFFSYPCKFSATFFLFSRRFNYFSFLSASFPTDFTDFTDLFCIFALRNIKITINMKKKNGMKVVLASTVMLLMAKSYFCSEIQGCEGGDAPVFWSTKIGMPSLMLRRLRSSHLISTRWIALWVLWWVSIAHDMTRHRPESELSNLLCDILVWGGKQFRREACLLRL